MSVSPSGGSREQQTLAQSAYAREKFSVQTCIKGKGNIGSIRKWDGGERKTNRRGKGRRRRGSMYVNKTRNSYCNFKIITGNLTRKTE